MRVAIYSPYLDTASGGERYMLTIGQVLSQAHQVDVLLDEALVQKGADKIKARNESLHGLDLSKVKFIQAPVGVGSSFWERLWFFRGYDLLIYNCDGSLFLSTAKKSVLHFQLPLSRIAVGGLWGKLKQSSWNLAIYNSKFTKEYDEKLISIKGKVVYPPVAVERFKALAKKKQIISVGRFALYNNPKKHDLMIEVFKRLVDERGLKGWSFHLAGGLMEGNDQFLAELRQLAKGYPIYFYPDISLNELIKLYGESSIYWHAMGYQETDPNRFEHFGIATVEAMASGCVPVVINKGGQKEIVEEGVSGLFWEEVADFMDQTLRVINEPKLRQKLADGARERAQDFSSQHFADHIEELL